MGLCTPCAGPRPGAADPKEILRNPKEGPLRRRHRERRQRLLWILGAKSARQFSRIFTLGRFLGHLGAILVPLGFQEGPRWPQECPKTPPRCPRRPTGGSQEPSGTLKDEEIYWKNKHFQAVRSLGLKNFQEPPKNPQESPKIP